VLPIIFRVAIYSRPFFIRLVKAVVREVVKAVVGEALCNIWHASASQDTDKIVKLQGN
jgi:hypothetical protein